jgi:hypothetical protein
VSPATPFAPVPTGRGLPKPTSAWARDGAGRSGREGPGPAQQQEWAFGSAAVDGERRDPGTPGRQGRRVVAAFIGTAFVQDDAEAACKQWRQVADQLRPKALKLAAFMDKERPT